MADMYDRFREMTIRNLKPRSQGGKGIAASLIQIVPVYNAITDMNELTEVRIPVSGIRASYRQRHIDNEFVRQSDVKFYLSPVQSDQVTAVPTPLTVDRFEVDGDRYVIINVKRWRHAGTDCGWLLQLRAA